MIWILEEAIGCGWRLAGIFKTQDRCAYAWAALAEAGRGARVRQIHGSTVDNGGVRAPVPAN